MNTPALKAGDRALQRSEPGTRMPTFGTARCPSRPATSHEAGQRYLGNQSVSTLESVKPINPPVAYIGGKRLLAKRIVPRIARVPHKLYAEPFIGMGGIFFRRAEKPKAEVINDVSGDVSTFFRILQRHYVPFMDMLRYQITSRNHFERLVKTKPETLTDLERAARFLYLQTVAFGGKVMGRNYGVNFDRGAPFDVSRLRPLLDDVHERLASVNIECLDWHPFIDRYDRPGTLFFLDPPYWGCEDDYGKNVFSPEDFAQLAERLAKVKGHFILTLNDTPEVRDLFARFHMEPVGLTYSVGTQPVKARELIISDFEEAVAPV